MDGIDFGDVPMDRLAGLIEVVHAKAPPGTRVDVRLPNGWNVGIKVVELNGLRHYLMRAHDRYSEELETEGAYWGGDTEAEMVLFIGAVGELPRTYEGVARDVEEHMHFYLEGMRHGQHWST